MSSDLQFPLSLPDVAADPLVSILMPNYNYEQYIEEAIQSILDQSYSNYELIICDDGSKDGSKDIARRFADSHEKIVLIEQANAGVSTALNVAFAASKGEIVCLLDSDDVFAHTKLEKTVQRCRRDSQAGFVLHGMRVVDGEGNVLYQLPRSGHFEEGWVAPDVIRRGGRWRSMPASGLSFRREVADLLFPLPVDTLPGMADAYLYMLAPLLTQVGYLPESLADYRLHGSNMTGSLSFDAASAAKFTRGMELVHESINARACPALFADMPLSLDHHLTYQEQTYLQFLFNKTPRSELLLHYARLLRLINGDDLYSVSRKWMGLVANGVAIGLPVSARPAWITWMMGAKWRKWLGK